MLFLQGRRNLKVLKEHKLCRRVFAPRALFSEKYFHAAELMVRDSEQPNLAVRRQSLPDVASDGFDGFFADTMARIHRVLKHDKAFTQQRLPELGVLTPVVFRFHGQIK